MKRISTRNAEIEYEVIGTGEPVLLIHGAMGAWGLRPLLAEPAISKDHQLIYYHRRGYAESTHKQESEATMSQQTEDIQQLLRTLDVENTHLVGHSFGGAIALAMAMERPDLVRSMVLIEPALLVGENAPSYRESLLNGMRQFNEKDAAETLDAFLKARSPNYRQSLDARLPGAFDQAVGDLPTAFEVDLPALLNWQFDEEMASMLTMPITVVLGTESNALWARFGETHQLLLDWLPNAEGAIVPGGTHLMPIEVPEATAAAIAHHLHRC